MVSTRTQLVLTALAASFATIGVISAYNTYTKRERRRNLNEDILRSLSKQELTLLGTKPAQKSDDDVTKGDRPERFSVSDKIGYDEELVREQLGRNYAFFGEDGMRQIRGGSVVIVGCGGVGSWAAVMLVRSCVRAFFRILAIYQFFLALVFL
jgi:tRNA threonylcarbamoyladenosine dehydratase